MSYVAHCNLHRGGGAGTWNRHSFPQLITKHSVIHHYSTVTETFGIDHKKKILYLITNSFVINSWHFFFVIYHKHVNDR